jgi:hypothetical protein
MPDKLEPEEAFPYEPPSEEIKRTYAHIFELEGPLENRFFKLLFDKAGATFGILMPI